MTDRLQILLEKKKKSKTRFNQENKSYYNELCLATLYK